MLTLKRVKVGVTSENIKTMILDAMATYGGLSNDNMASKWICLGCDGGVVFQGVHANMITQIKKQLALYLFGVHCVAHWTNVVILVLNKLTLVAHIEGML